MKNFYPSVNLHERRKNRTSLRLQEPDFFAEGREKRFVVGSFFRFHVHHSDSHFDIRDERMFRGNTKGNENFPIFSSVSIFLIHTLPISCFVLRELKCELGFTVHDLVP